MNIAPDSGPVTETESEDAELLIAHSVLRERYQVLREGFREEIRLAGGALEWLSAQCPRSQTSLTLITTDPVVMESLVLSETRAFWVGHEARLRECAKCPTDGAFCAGSQERLPEGLLTRLALQEPSQITEEVKWCRRYIDFYLARRLESVGVDKRLCRMKLHGISDVPPPEVVRVFDGFIGSGRGQRSPANLQVLIEGSLAREYAAALLRSAMKNFPSGTYRSVNVPELVRVAMNAMTVKEQSPFLALVDVDVLLLDAVDPESIKPGSYARKEVVWLYERRRDQGRATIIASTMPAKEDFLGAYVLRV